MPWDIALDGESGDLLFSPTHDLLGTTGDGLTKQRILLRCKIPRGGWQYDEDGTLGSNLHLITRAPSAAQLAEAPSLVQEALEPMDDISVEDVQVSTDENNRLVVAVTYTNVVVDDEEDITEIETSIPTIDATMTI